MDTYFINVMRSVRLVTPNLQANGVDLIINISTFAAFEPDPVFPTPGVFSAGFAASTKLFSDKYAIENTPMNNALPSFIGSLPEMQKCKDRIPLERYGRSEDIAATVSFLASEDS